jgi:hypothetical protein
MVPNRQQWQHKSRSWEWTHIPHNDGLLLTWCLRRLRAREGETEPVPKLIKRFLDGLAKKPPDRDLVVWDDDLEGFGARVSPEGRISFVVQYRIGRRSRRITVGPFGTYTPAKARDEAETLLATA